MFPIIQTSSKNLSTLRLLRKAYSKGRTKRMYSFGLFFNRTDFSTIVIKIEDFAKNFFIPFIAFCLLKILNLQLVKKLARHRLLSHEKNMYEIAKNRSCFELKYLDCRPWNVCIKTVCNI